MKKNPETARALMRALAVNISQAPKYATLAADMAYGDERREPDTQTVKSYLEMFKDLYLLTDLRVGSRHSAQRVVRTKPKRYFVDPSLPAAVLGAAPNTLMRDTQTLGDLFETLCIRDLNVYLSAMPGAGIALRITAMTRGLKLMSLSSCLTAGGVPSK